MPAQTIAKGEFGLFAATLLCAAAVEAIAELTGTKSSGKKKTAAWLAQRLPCFQETPIDSKKILADLFHEYFRNGLAHNALIKSLGQVTTEIPRCVEIQDGKVSVNPTALVEAVIAAFESQLSEIKSDLTKRKAFSQRVNALFKEEKEKSPTQE